MLWNTFPRFMTENMKPLSSQRGYDSKHCQRHNGHKSWSNFNFRNLTKLKLKIFTKPSFRILAKIQLCKLNQTSAAKYWPNFSFKISPELQFQNLDKILCSKSEQKLSFMTKPQLPILQQTVANTILIINISNSNNPNKFWVGIFTR